MRSIEFPIVSSLSLTVCFIPYIQQTSWLCCSSALGILCFVCSRIKYFRCAVLNAACCCKCRSSVGLYGLCSSWVYGCAAQKRLNRRQTHVDPRKHVLDWGGPDSPTGKNTLDGRHILGSRHPLLDGLVGCRFGRDATAIARHVASRSSDAACCHITVLCTVVWRL